MANYLVEIECLDSDGNVLDKESFPYSYAVTKELAEGTRKINIRLYEQVEY